MDIKGDDQLGGAQQWVTKSLTEEKSMKSFSKVSGKVGVGGVRGGGRPAHAALLPPVQHRADPCCGWCRTVCWAPVPPLPPLPSLMRCGSYLDGTHCR